MTYARGARSCPVANAVHQSTIRVTAQSLVRPLKQACITNQLLTMGNGCLWDITSARGLQGHRIYSFFRKDVTVKAICDVPSPKIAMAAFDCSGRNITFLGTGSGAT